MSFLDWLITKKKPLSKMTRSELRRQELLLEKDRNQLVKRVRKLATDKQDMFEKGATEKTPEVRKMLAQEFEQHVHRVEGRYRTVIDEYGAINPAEFFAVAAETFFEKPLSLKRQYPDLYGALQHYFRQDPANKIGDF